MNFAVSFWVHSKSTSVKSSDTAVAVVAAAACRRPLAATLVSVALLSARAADVGAFPFRAGTTQMLFSLHPRLLFPLI